MGAPGQGKALLPSVEPKDPPGTAPPRFEGSRGNEAISCAATILPGWFASVRMNKREKNPALLSPQMAGNIFREWV